MPPQKPQQIDDLEPFGVARDRRIAFAREYASNGRHGPAAYRAAFSADASDAVAASRASDLMRTADVRAEIRRIEAEAIEDYRRTAGITLERTLAGVAALAFYDPRNLFNDDGSPKSINDLDDVTAMAVEGIDIQEHHDEAGNVVARTRKIRLAKRTAPLDMLMKHLGGYQKDNAQKGEGVANALADLISAMRRSAIPVVQQVGHDGNSL